MRDRIRCSSHQFGLGVLVTLVSLTLLGAAVRHANATRYQDLALFSSVLDIVRRNYVEPVEEHALMQSAVRGLLENLDPHSAFMTAEDYEEMQVDTKGEFHGLGIEITKKQGEFIEVVSPIDGTPAFRAGIAPHDQITSICPTEVPEEWEEGESCRKTDRMTLFEAVQLMRGKKGTVITIHVYREGFSEPRPFTLERDVVQVASTEGELLEPGYGHLRIRAFQERTSEEVARELAELEAGSPNGLQGLVIDLRDNPGGLLNQAVDVADNWLDEGLIVYTEGRDESQRQEFRARQGEGEIDYPIVVLVNAGSASASEIVAGALQDHHRALVLGTPTFGKGSVQTVYPLEGGAGLRLTTALYYTPSGRSIQEVGIVPDIVVEAPVPEQPSAARRVRERDLTGHFTHRRADPSDTGEEGAAKSLASARAEPEGEADPVLARALGVLKSWAYFERLNERRILHSAKSAPEPAGREPAPESAPATP